MTATRGPRVLVYGFPPFGAYPANISEQAIRLLPRLPGVRTVILPVRFDRSRFLAEIERFRPTRILGVGQCPRGRKIRIERVARNRMGKPGGELRAIERGGPARVALSWVIAPTPNMRESSDAGTYVCNFSMYVIARAVAGTRTRSAFLHVPMSLDPAHVAREIARVIRIARPPERGSLRLQPASVIVRP